jgi:hypothetical protein
VVSLPETLETVAMDELSRDVDGVVPVEVLEDRLFDGFREQVESMIVWARTDAVLAMEHAPLEEQALAEAFKAVQLLTEAHMMVRAAREQRRGDVIDADGRTRVTAETGQEHTRTMLFGPVRTSRIGYRRYHAENLYPQDADLNWAVTHSYSAGVLKRVAGTAAMLPFAQTAQQISTTLPIKIGKRQVEALTVAAAVDFEAFYAARRPAARPDGVGLLITADGSALPVRPEALRPATAKAAADRAQAAARGGWPDDPGQLRKSTKRSAELVCVADIPAVPRTAEDILAALFPAPGKAPDRPGRARHGPIAEGKTLFASVKQPIAQVVADGFTEAQRRDPEHARTWYAIVDGNNAQIDAIRSCAEKYQVTVPILIDFIHVVQYLWKAAGTFFYPNDPAGRDWVKTQAEKILHGNTRDVATGIRRRATRFGYTGREREGADTCATYLDNKRDFLDYPAFLAAGRPVASGLIEGACRWLVKDRMEVTGARWGLEGAEAVLKLRALVGNGDFDNYFTYHLTQEKRRNHDSRYHQPEPQT